MNYTLADYVMDFIVGAIFWIYLLVIPLTALLTFGYVVYRIIGWLI